MANIETCREAQDVIEKYRRWHPIRTRGMGGTVIGILKAGDLPDVNTDFTVYVLDSKSAERPRYARGVERTIARAGLTDLEVQFTYTGQTQALPAERPISSSSNEV